MGNLATILTSAAVTGAGIAIGKGIEKVAERAATGTGSSLLNAVGAMKSAWASGAGQNLVSRSKPLRVEPYLLLDDRVARLPYAKTLVQAAQRLFTPYYMLSVAADNVIGSLKISQRLDKFSPDRDLHAASTRFLSFESFEHGLPRFNATYGLEAYSYSSEAQRPQLPPKQISSIGTKDLDKVASDIQNLSVGQIVELDIVEGGHSMKLPIQIRMRPLGMSSSAVSEILALGGEDTSRAARYRQWKVGDITLIRDLFFNQDRIRRYREAVMGDKSNYFRKVHARANRGKLATLLTGQPSIGEASSIAIITRETQIATEEKMHNRLDDFETRQSIFEAGLMMMIMVVDDDSEVVTIYTRDIDDVTRYTLKDLEVSSKSSGNNDLTDILKMMMEGRVPGRL